MTDQWAAKLDAVLQNLPDPYHLSIQLLALRKGLARTLELARHPGLPGPLRDALTESAEGSIRRHQQEVERAVRELWRTSPGPLAEQYLQAVHEHSFVTVIGYDSLRPGGRMSAVPIDRPTQSGSGQPAGAVGLAPTRRRIIFDT